jgi:hypothetical protein
MIYISINAEMEAQEGQVCHDCRLLGVDWAPQTMPQIPKSIYCCNHHIMQVNLSLHDGSILVDQRPKAGLVQVVLCGRRSVAGRPAAPQDPLDVDPL